MKNKILSKAQSAKLKTQNHILKCKTYDSFDFLAVVLTFEL